MMDLESIQEHIQWKKNEKQDLLRLSLYIDVLHLQAGLSENTLKEIRAKISSRIAQCDISIRDHEKLLFS